MPGTSYVVELTGQEREHLDRLLRKGVVPAFQQRHARVLLLADHGEHGGEKLSDREIARAVRCGKATVERIRRRFVLEGFEEALGRKYRKSYRSQMDGRTEAYLVALACSQPPAGYKRWTLRLLADKVVELHILEHCGKDSIHRALKKTNLSLG
jgi:transposase